MNRIVVRNPRWLALSLLATSLVQIAAGAILLLAVELEWVLPGWGFIATGGLSAAVGIWALLDSRPRFVLNEEGATGRALQVGAIPWTAVRAARRRYWYFFPYIELQMNEPEIWEAKLPMLARLQGVVAKPLGFAPIRLDIGMSNVKPETVLQFVNARLAELNNA